MSRRIPGVGVQDANGKYVKPKASKPSASIEPPPSGISTDDLIDKHHLILYRETIRLLESSSSGKLSKDDAQCVRDNLKLLLELKKREKEFLDNLTDEDLQKLVDK